MSCFSSIEAIFQKENSKKEIYLYKVLSDAQTITVSPIPCSIEQRLREAGPFGAAPHGETKNPVIIPFPVKLKARIPVKKDRYPLSIRPPLQTWERLSRRCRKYSVRIRDAGPFFCQKGPLF